MNLVDSSAWLAYFADEPNAEIFAPILEDTQTLLVSVVCIYEVFKVVLRERGEEDALQVYAAMQQGTVVDLDASLAVEAAALGLEEKLAFPDSLILATARRHHATLWTQDAHFASLPEVRYYSKSNGS